MGIVSGSEYDKNKDFTSLESWQSAREVRLYFYKEVIPLIPKYGLKDHLLSCFDLNYIDEEKLSSGQPLIENTKKLLNGYIRFKTIQKE